MADLSTISASDPADGEAVSNGASRIRAAVDATKTSFDVEHALAGAHSFINGAPGARPAASTSGRIFIDTTNTRVERDTGSAWAMLNAVQPGYAYTSGSTPTGVGGSYLTLQTVSVDIPTGGRLVVIAWADYICGANPASLATILQVDAVSITGSGNFITFASAEERGIPTFGYLATPTAGTRSVTLKATSITSVAFTASLRALLVLVI